MAKTFEEKMVDIFCFRGIDGSMNRCKYYVDLNSGVLELGHINSFGKKDAKTKDLNRPDKKGLIHKLFDGVSGVAGGVFVGIVSIILVLIILFREDDNIFKLLLFTIAIYQMVGGYFKYALKCGTPREIIMKIRTIRLEQNLAPAWFGKLVSTKNTTRRLDFINDSIAKLQDKGIANKIIGLNRSDIPTLNQLKNQLERNLDYTSDRDLKAKAVATAVIESPKAVVEVAGKIGEVAGKIGTAAYDYTVSCDKGLQQKEIRKLKEEKIELQKQLSAEAKDIIDVEVKPDANQHELRKFTDEEILKMVKG